MVKLRDRNFIISTLTTLAIMAIAFGVSFAMADRESTSTLAYTGEEAAVVVQAVEAGAEGGPDASVGDDDADAPGGAGAPGEADESAAPGGAGESPPEPIEALEMADEGAVEAAVSSGDADAGLVNTDDGWMLIGDTSVPTEIATSVTGAVNAIVMETNAQAAGTSMAELTLGSEVEERLLDADDSNPVVMIIASVVFMFLFYLAAALFGYGIASSVIEEKQSRVVEILAAAISLRQLLFGKILGATVLAIGQLALLLGIGVIGLSFTEYLDLLPEVGTAAIWYLVFFLFGFATLAALFAVSGSLGTRAEDVQATSTPVLMLVMVAAFGGFLVEGTAQVVASYIPVVSTVAMPVRLLDQSVMWWEPVVSLGISVVATAVVLLLAERMYRRSLLQTGSKMSWRQALSSGD